jgi:dipeptidyl aminopeptidase/acylaminoacyl peptidase
MSRSRANTPGQPVRIAWLACISLILAVAAAAAGPTRPLTFHDLMKFRAIERPVLSEDGTVVAYATQPDRGDGEGLVHHLASGRVFKVERGGQPAISKDSRWVAMTTKVPFAAADKPAKERPKPGMALVDAGSGAIVHVDNVERFAFSEDGRWLAYVHPAPEAAKKSETTDALLDGQETKPDTTDRKAGGTLKLRNLASGVDHDIAFVAAFTFDRPSKYLAYVVSDRDGKGNGVYYRELSEPSRPGEIARAEEGKYEALTWTREGSRLAFLSSGEPKKGQPQPPATLCIWDGDARRGAEVVAPGQAPKGWTLPLKNDLAWSRDGKRLFFGFKPGEAQGAPPSMNQAPKGDADPYDVDALLAKAEVDVWHWNDPRIIPQQKRVWDREKDRTYRAVLHVESKRVVPLADQDVPDVELPENDRFALASSDVPYQKQTTWGERQRDIYLVDLAAGSRKLVVPALGDSATLTPDGRTVLYYAGGHWHAYDCETGSTRNLTGALNVTLFDEENDTPSSPRSYGTGGWVDDGAAVLVYDRYDIWQVPLRAGEPINLTAGEGRRRQVTFRALRLDPERRSYRASERLLLSAYHNREKAHGFYAAVVGKPGVEARIDEKRRFRFLSKASAADVVMYTRESYTEFPDVWVSDTAFEQPKRVSDVNPQTADFAWGSAELVEWSSMDGVPLQGVLIKPGNYEAGKRYPVIVYFYERQSQRLYEFNETVVNHRPSFPVYTGAGYAIFLPDVVFDIGRPGMSMVKCLVPGVQKLIDMGVADPKAIGLHGHSWGGYGTAYVVTQTNIFAAAIAGAPVANMTSAYGGIRWESGLARQFQYEQTQSRIGGSLWDYPERYIENSPLFFADRVQTPLLIQHGDDDGAVPWYQAIEMYLALRRFGKDAIYLQYRGEPHHLRKYPNKIDYAIRMKEYFDHYLKGEPAPEWISKGVPYRGK